MAAILFIVAWGLIDFHHIGPILRRHPRERIIFLVTFVGTLIDLEKGIFAGVLVSLVFYLYRTSRPSVRELVPDPEAPDDPRRKWRPGGGGHATLPAAGDAARRGLAVLRCGRARHHRFRALDEPRPAAARTSSSAPSRWVQRPVGLRDARPGGGSGGAPWAGTSTSSASSPTC